ncbi:MAG TPA: glycosyltransferase [Patescibacteria group bacterium]|nr:glycosyltransferase [Patescibacteria group bacterium]
MKVAIVRGKHLNQYEMQIFEPLVKDFDITAFGSLSPFHDTFSFPTVKLPSPMDLPEFPFKMPILNRLFIDAHYLYGLEQKIEGFDIAHSAETYYHYTQQALNAKKRGKVKKVVATVLENIPFNNEGIWGRASFKKRAREELDHIIALTERTKNALLLEGADEKKITVISHGIDTKRFFPNPKKNFHTKDIMLLFCGRLEKYKGVYEVIFAVKRLLADKSLRNYGFHVTIIGDGSEKNNMQEMETRLGIAKHITHKNVAYKDMPKAYQNADIYLGPSKAGAYWIEQYNTTLLEAQATGLPIVTTYSGGIPENVGNAALLVPPNDSFAIYEAIKQFALHPNLRETYAKKARERAEHVHDVSIIANKIKGVYNSLL